MNREEYRDLFVSAVAVGIAYWVLQDLMIIYIGLGVLVILGFIPPLRKANHLMWKYITLGMQFVMHPILFSIIYFVALVPLGLAFRLFKKRKTDTASTFLSIDNQVDRTFFETPW